MSDRDVIEHIKNKLDIVNVIGETIDLKRSGDFYKGAISNSSKSGKSLNVNQRQQYYIDWASGEKGDVFNWIAYVNGLDTRDDFPTILKIAAEKADVELEKSDFDSGYQEGFEISTFLTALAEYYRQNITEEVSSYIYDKWGITDKTIDEIRIGLAPKEDVIFKEFGDLFDEDTIKKSGMVIKTKSGWHDFFQGRIVFPYWKNGKVVFNIGRKTDYTPNVTWEQGKYKKQLTKTENNPYVSEWIKNKYFYGEDSLRLPGDYMVISEGVTDCIMAIQNGIPSISPVTTNVSELQKYRLIDLAKRKRQVYICNDNEINNSGLKGAMRTADILQKNGIFVKIIELPD